MDTRTAAELFSADVERLRDLAQSLGLRTVEGLGERVATFTVRWRGRPLRVVMRGAENYPLSPTSVMFVSDNDAALDGPEFWPANVPGINATERFVCVPGFAEGHQRHSDWPSVPEKNRIHRLAQVLVIMLGGVDPVG